MEMYFDEKKMKMFQKFAVESAVVKRCNVKFK